MLTPAYKLTLGRQVVDSTAEPRASTLVDLAVTLDLDTPADGFTLVLGNVGSLAATRGDAVAIDLGYADDGGLERVVAGTATVVDANLTTTRVTGISGASSLLALFVEQTFETKTAGAIARDLAGRAAPAVEVARAEDGTLFPLYVVDGRRSAWHHLADLAELCGFDLYVGPDGKLVFERFAGGKTAHVFEVGKHVLALEVLRTPPLASRVEAWGESPTASAGDDAAAWLTRDFSGSRGVAAGGGSGSGSGSGPLLLLERPALRTRNAAAAAALAALTTVERRTLRGRLTVLGRPQVHLGDAIHLRGHADDSLNTLFQVRSVTHRLTKAAGFTTVIGFRSMAAPAAPTAPAGTGAGA
jgi:phage protein D